MASTARNPNASASTVPTLADRRLHVPLTSKEAATLHIASCIRSGAEMDGAGSRDILKIVLARLSRDLDALEASPPRVTVKLTLDRAEAATVRRLRALTPEMVVRLYVLEMAAQMRSLPLYRSDEPDPVAHYAAFDEQDIDVA